MKDSFEHRKIFAAIIFCLCALSVAYSIFFPRTTPALSDGTFVTAQEPQFPKPKGKGSSYAIQFQFLNPWGSLYTITGTTLKYTDYKSILNDIKAFDTVHLKTIDNNIYQVTAKGKNYVNLDAVLNEEMQDYRFMFFCRIMICIAVLPIFFFKKRPIFWHSGFEFEFRFTYLFFAIMFIAICVYINLNGSSYLTGFRPE